MERRRFLRAGIAALTGLAGCSRLSGTTSESPPTDTVSPMASPEFTTTYTPKPLPEKPETITPQVVREFVVGRETACFWNELLSPKTKLLEAEVGRTQLNETGTGYVVRIEVVGSETTPAAHGDYEYRVNYFVNDTTVLRTDSYGGGFPGPDPRETGEPVDPARCNG